MDSYETGTLPGTGAFRCITCEYQLSLAAGDELPACPACGGVEYARASLFTPRAADFHPAAGEDTDWLAEVRSGLDTPGDYLAYDDGSEVQVFPLGREWTRIGRSLAADIRFDDPTVSRRHALLVRGPGGVRVLDDRSLNGVWVNGDQVEWQALGDGDEILVGRHALRYLEVRAAPARRAPTREGGEALPR